MPSRTPVSAIRLLADATSSLSSGLVTLAIGVVLVMGACGQDASVDTTAAPPGADSTLEDSPSPSGTSSDVGQTDDTAPATSVVESTTTTAAEASTSTAEPIGIATSRPPILVAGPEGIHLVGESSQITLLDAAVMVAADDRLGGVVYQVSAGRFFNEPETTIVYWLPANSRDGSPLLVPTGRQWLRLVDVEVIDGATQIVYIRSEGENRPEDFSDTLRTYDLVTGEVDEIAQVGAWESGAGQVSFGGSTFAVNWYAEASSGFDFLAPDGSRTEVVADPYAGDLYCFDGQMESSTQGASGVPAPCAETASISDDGTELAYAEFRRDAAGVIAGQDLIVVPVDGSQPARRIDLQWRDGMGWVDHIDVVAGHAIVNRRNPETGSYGSGIVVDLMSGELTALELPGLARFTTSIPAP